jgi:hypothetical protein
MTNIKDSDLLIPLLRGEIGARAYLILKDSTDIISWDYNDRIITGTVGHNGAPILHDYGVPHTVELLPDDVRLLTDPQGGPGNDFGDGIYISYIDTNAYNHISPETLKIYCDDMLNHIHAAIYFN